MPSNGFYFSSHNGRHHIIRWDDGTMGNWDAKYFSKYRVSIKAIIVERLVSIHVYALLHFANNFPVVMLQCCRVLRFGFVWSGSYLSTSAAYFEYTFIAMMVTKEKYESNIDEDDEEEKTKLLKVAFLPPPSEWNLRIDRLIAFAVSYFMRSFFRSTSAHSDKGQQDWIRWILLQLPLMTTMMVLTIFICINPPSLPHLL